MKTGIFCFGALSLAGLAAARPSLHRQYLCNEARHVKTTDNVPGLHDHLHEKRQEVIVTEVDYVTATTPDVIVYVNDDGEVLYTSTVGVAAPTSVAAGESSAQAAYTAIVHTSAPASTATYVAPAPASSAAAPASSSSSSSSSGSSASGSSLSGHSVSYSPYTGSYQANDVTCKTADQVNSDFDAINGYSMVRIYGTDCNQVANVLSAASAKGMKVFAGVYDINEVESEIATIVAAAAGNWDAIHTISIGNELVNSGSATVSEVTAAITTARGLLKAAGYKGYVVTVDTFNAIIANPALCAASDYAAANAHPFFDTTMTASGAGAWVAQQQSNVATACPKQNVWITETGWPSQGDANGDAIPSQSNQDTAVGDIKSTMTSNVIFLTAYNDYWKNPGSLNIEQYWGIIN